ncbi:hypothetical protein TVAG_376800 [Trichomonas vaginalis G3]|uniref:Glycosyltransferase 61 catalytic domain-containing protein n=1 Tax=Trichomonas vaginalis (strain ATCC PRA-98 / G3) TaxID=412133 RepID=A2FW25_TRIV3|nr:glycosyltransferase family [Trichomonas vaginalis G3]EAX90896.1 hypothetical protein TVAG_376800 [Trichomonas vaginalis G3]KAI5504026.1 glycosyltransferase family [Trichomonas vaginalis G3]|eukprot:XP_001303826.1 hypothetical protein [Trichomonas vaginalis G3]
MLFPVTDPINIINIQCKTHPIIYQNHPKGWKWFYQLNYEDCNRYFDIVSKNDTEIAKMWHNGEFFFRMDIPGNRIFYSIVYVAVFNYAYLSREPATLDYGLKLYVDKQHGEYKQKKTVGEYNIGVYVIDLFEMFGHLIHDFLCGLMYIPKEVIDQGVVMLAPTVGKCLGQMWLDAIGYGNKIKLLTLKQDEQVLVHKLYYVSTLIFGHGCTIGGFRRLRNLIFDKYKLDQIKPTKFQIINRIGKERLIHNVDELLGNLTLYCKIDEGEKWIYTYPNSTDIKDVAKLWSGTKLLIAPAGSGIYNSVFMAPRTGMVIMMTHRIDMPNFHLALAGEFYMIGVGHKKMGFRFTEYIPCYAKLMAEMAQRVLDCMKVGKYTNLEGLSDPYSGYASPYGEIEDYI